ncbi:SDR family NAD(P)-dependent oxidoreductase [Shewanella benthica]|uniref:Putative short-chain dehydrogenase n=1 Tax=Shewanella benthica KT99 TaxID=314608 RepID=A9D9S3_9GAMM|nr:SDR family NAD(P)-dependent oxidoreductase [Shewanella benthica]EDQ00814.1 putative short-chain dehydrogenase [Shewanella benthica KT99]
MILITGASSGLGAALANIYGTEGQSLLLTGRNEQRLARVVSTISGEVNAIAADLCQPREISALLDSLSQAPDTVIHCAGSGYFGAIEQQQPDSIEKLIHNNLTATILLLRELVKRYRNNKINVVVVMSTAAQVAKAGESTYCAVKWAIRGLVESLRLELKGSPMKLIAVYPGGMATDFWKTSGKELDTSGFMTAQEVAIMLKQALVNADHGYVSDITINRG